MENYILNLRGGIAGSKIKMNDKKYMMYVNWNTTAIGRSRT